jgi:hypothetical protein
MKAISCEFFLYSESQLKLYEAIHKFSPDENN